jgi:hypothetical protein
MTRLYYVHRKTIISRFSSAGIGKSQSVWLLTFLRITALHLGGQTVHKTLKVKALWSAETSQTTCLMSHIPEELNQHHCKSIISHKLVLNIILIYANLNNYISQNNEKLITVPFHIICLILAVTNGWQDLPSWNKTLSPSTLKMLMGERVGWGNICNFTQNWYNFSFFFFNMTATKSCILNI